MIARSRRQQADSAATFDGTLTALCTAAFACHGAGRVAEAIGRYQRILSFKDLPVIRNNLGHAFAGLGKLDAAIVEYRRAVALKPDYAEAFCNWGVALSNLDRVDEAEAKFRRAIAVEPSLAGAFHNLGVLLKERGRLGEAVEAAEEAIRLAPGNVAYHEHLAALRPFVADDDDIKALEALELTTLGAQDRIHLHFALAKAYEDTGQPARAFAQLLAGNRLKRAQVVYDESAKIGAMERARGLLTADFIAARQGLGDQSRLPVFIVGMPRSGTTLIEQILASHPEVFGAGELNLFAQSVDAVANAMPRSPPFPELAAAMEAEHFRTLGAFYCDRLAQRAPGASRVVDKMPENFLFTGLIHLALPNATIIHAVRDPVDTCVSCFSILFAQQPHTYDLAELGRYYRQYRALMAHWRRVLPPQRMIEVRYEDLVGDLEAVARRVVDRCGLAWDARCLDFHRTERSVRTASATQVRRPIYRSSIGRWRKYESFLGPLLAELAPSPI